MNKIILLIVILSFQINLYSANHIVKMLNQGTEGVMVFEPAVLKINPGDSVTFKSVDAAHNSASISSMIPNNAQTQTQFGSGLFYPYFQWKMNLFPSNALRPLRPSKPSGW